MKKFLLAALAIFTILGCSSDDNMPSLSSINLKPYCRYYNYNGNYKCSPMSIEECQNKNGDNYGNNSTCTPYCGYYIGANYKCTPMSNEECQNKNGDNYRNDNTCGGGNQQEQYIYCLYYNEGSSVCNIMSSKNCNNYYGEEFENQKYCDEARQEQQNSYSYCLYRIGGNYRCNYMNTRECSAVYSGELYSNDNSCGNYWWSSSSFIPSSSSSSSYEYTGGSCDEEDYYPEYIGYAYQRWMTKNMSCYVPGSKCYNDDPANCNKYGRLYDWVAAMQACPEGWRLPSKQDWEDLFDFVLEYNEEEDDYEENNNKDRYLRAEKYLKATKGWGSGSGGNGQDTHGFAAMPGGNGAYDNNGNLVFYRAGSHGYWWSSTQYNNSAYDLHMSNGEGFANNDKKYLFSVRCIEDY